MCKSKSGSIHSQRHLQKVNYPQIRRQLIFWKCKPLASDRINCPLRATERHYSTKLKCNIQSLMSDEVTLICRVMLPTDLPSLIHLTQFTPISCSLQLSRWLTYSRLCYSLCLLGDPTPDTAKYDPASLLQDASFKICISPRQKLSEQCH